MQICKQCFVRLNEFAPNRVSNGFSPLPRHNSFLSGYVIFRSNTEYHDSDPFDGVDSMVSILESGPIRCLRFSAKVESFRIRVSSVCL